MSLSKPQLPSDFLASLLSLPMMTGFSSAIFTKGMHEARLMIVNGTHPDRALSSYHFIDGVVSHPFLHHAADCGDPALACEMLRLGAEVGNKDSEGCTPLLRALRRVVFCTGAKLVGSRLKVGAAMVKENERELERAVYISRLLIEQHSDVNAREKKGKTPLSVACAAPEWTLIEMLLQHGADPSTLSKPGSPSSYDRLPLAMRARFAALVAAIHPSGPRPARPCPCFSGNTILACHGAGKKPYPLDFLCRCGSNKTYKACCSRRKVDFVERWSEEDQWLQPSHTQLKVIEGVSEEAAKAMQAACDELRRGGGEDPFGQRNPEIRAASCHLFFLALDILCARGQVDPAYAYAMREVKCIPNPQGRATLKRECLETRDAWNAAVDSYILLGKDKRSRIDIERAAKIGISLGTLYPKCEGPGCCRLEGIDGKKLAVCSKCHISVYCSRHCQSSAWASHKSRCGRPDQLEQALPSQIAYRKFIAQFTATGAEMLMNEGFP